MSSADMDGGIAEQQSTSSFNRISVTPAELKLLMLACKDSVFPLEQLGHF